MLKKFVERRKISGNHSGGDENGPDSNKIDHTGDSIEGPNVMSDPSDHLDHWKS